MDLSENWAAGSSGTETKESCSSDGGPEAPRYIVGIGASAGGLEALEQFFEKMPAESGLAFVVVQHLSPDFKSLMNELLARWTRIPIRRVEDGMRVEANTIYLIPPKKEMIISEGRLLLTDKDPAQGFALPIDHFFRSLAQDVGDRSVGVVLSGTGSDGSRGIREIHDSGGLVLVQSLETAKFDGMPKSAVETGISDFVLSPQEMPGTLLRYIQHPLSEELTRPRSADTAAESAMDTVYRLLRDRHGIDFTHYKPTTVTRRTERRLLLNQSLDLEDYVRRLESDPIELNQLYKDLLIGVTRFFRDQEAFAYIETEALPRLFNSLPGDEELRIWVAGCATGEEAYSLAILVQERIEALRRPVKAKIFATDVHRSSLDIASQGIYSEASLIDVSAERLRRFFLRKGDAFQVCPELRQMVVFAQHNIIKDAPFTRLDLISCRNLVIYLQPLAQKKALSLFHFGLKTGGVLFLGPSESPGDLGDEFETLEGRWKIFRKRREARLPADVRLPLPVADFRLRSSGAPALPYAVAFDTQLLGVYDSLLDDYMPPSLLVSENRELLQTFGGANRFLRVRDGRMSTDVLEMVDAELRMALAGALQRSFKDASPVVYKGLRLLLPEGERLLNLTVKPLQNRRSNRLCMLITFEEWSPAAPPISSVPTEIDFQQVSSAQMQSLEAELSYTKENLQATIEELETSNEELQATNEELVASNEELQSTNEELHSVNEELYTVNGEYQKKIAELTELNADMDNLLASTEVHTIFLDASLAIRKFTPKIAETFNLLPQDIGRRIDSFSHGIQHDSLIDDLRAVLATSKPFEKEVQDRFGHWFLLRILPYRTGGSVSGVVLTLIDIAGLKAAETCIRQQERQIAGILENSPALISVKDVHGRYVLMNQAFRALLGVGEQEALGKTDYDLFPREFADKLVQYDPRVLAEGAVVNAEKVFPHAEGPRVYLSTKFPIRDDRGRIQFVGGIKTEVTQLKLAESQAREAVQQRDRFLAMLSHELRNPLAAILNAAGVMEAVPDPQHTAQSCRVIARQAQHMARLLDDLLDVSRITQGKISIRKEVIDLAPLAQEAVEPVRPMIEAHGHRLQIDVTEQPLYVDGDRARLLQVLENLLTNAVKYTPDGGRISLAVQREDSQAVVTVDDTGRGIPAAMLESIFELFVQSDTTLERSQGGMGVGLTLVRSLVGLHGGTVTAYSDGPGQGSRFVVRLPLSRQSPPSRSQPPRRAGSGLNVLIVEDNADSREMLRLLLQFSGYRVVVAEDGPSGIRAVASHRPDVALIDIGLPGIDGYQVARQIRADPQNRNLRLIALTGYGRPEDRQAVSEAGFDDHLVKPVKIDTLCRALEPDIP